MFNSIKARLILFVLCFQMIFIGVSTFYWLSNFLSNQETSFYSTINLSKTFVAPPLASAAWDFDQGGAVQTLEALSSNPDYVFSQVWSNGGVFVQHSVAEEWDTSWTEISALLTAEENQNDMLTLDNGDLALVTPLLGDSGEVVGQAVLGFSLARLEAKSYDLLVEAIIFAVFTIIIAAAATYLMSARIAAPLNRIITMINSISGGNTNFEVTDNQRKDEIGKIAQAVGEFRNKTDEMRELEKDAVKNRNQTEQEREHNEEIKAKDAEKLSDTIDALAHGLTQLSNGDLTANISKPFDGKLDRLRTDFNSSVAKLSETMSHITNVSVTLKDNSNEISKATNDLSRRTETQAASLEETSAALDEITATVRETSERAKEASDKAKDARHDTEESGKVVSNAVVAMEGIEKASADITNIINVIDEIAFQTNLLALNAGVEAARAGEAGKGFAVVAQEVRELAQRSAGAAKEIKELIDKSGSEVSNGVSLVRQTGEALAKISEHVTEIDARIETISQGAAEQLTGIQEVNSSVNSMDQVTQQNAAMVEENTAVTQQIADEVTTLADLIKTFKVSGRPVGVSSSQISETEQMHANLASVPVAVSNGHASKPSPAKVMVNKLSNAFATRADGSDWNEF